MERGRDEIAFTFAGMGRKNPYCCYVVWNGRAPGVYDSWEECAAQVEGFTGAVYKGFESRKDALNAFEQGPKNYIGQQKSPSRSRSGSQEAGAPDPLSLSVDAACSGNPGRLEYRGVDTGTGAEVFRVGPFEEGTVNIGEFLAIVHGLAFLKERDLNLPVYSDSQTAIKWVKDKRANTRLPRSELNDNLFKLISRAETWLHNNTWQNPVRKWNTAAWGEIPADFGRK